MGSAAPACDVHSRGRCSGWRRECGPGQPVLRLTFEMSIAVRADHNSIRDKLRRIGWHHPECWVVMAAAVAWLFMAGMSHPHASHSHASHATHTHASHTHASHTHTS